jgi:co-chaperonin GroES (HSP10)
MIKINKHDNIIDILQKIKQSNTKKVVLFFPFGHNVLYNKFLLKSIKNFDLNKKIIIKTNDILSKKILKDV